MSDRIRFIGGPHDGTTQTWTTREPPPLIQLPYTPQPLTPHDTATYQPRLDESHLPARDDDGTIVYEYVDSW